MKRKQGSIEGAGGCRIEIDAHAHVVNADAARLVAALQRQQLRWDRRGVVMLAQGGAGEPGVQHLASVGLGRQSETPGGARGRCLRHGAPS